MYNYNVNMTYWPAGGPTRQGPDSLMLTLALPHLTVGASHLTSLLTWELSHFQS